MIATTIAVLAFLGALLAVVECVAMIKRFEDLNRRISYLEYLQKSGMSSYESKKQNAKNDT